MSAAAPRPPSSTGLPASATVTAPRTLPQPTSTSAIVLAKKPPSALAAVAAANGATRVKQAGPVKAGAGAGASGTLATTTKRAGPAAAAAAAGAASSSAPKGPAKFPLSAADTLLDLSFSDDEDGNELPSAPSTQAKKTATAASSAAAAAAPSPAPVAPKEAHKRKADEAGLDVSSQGSSDSDSGGSAASEPSSSSSDDSSGCEDDRKKSHKSASSAKTHKSKGVKKKSKQESKPAVPEAWQELNAQLAELVGLHKCKQHFAAVQALLQSDPKAAKNRLHIFLHGERGLGRTRFAQLYAQLVMRKAAPKGRSTLPRPISGAKLECLSVEELKRHKGTRGVLLVNRVECCSERVLLHLETMLSSGVVLILIGKRNELVDSDDYGKDRAAQDLLCHIPRDHQIACRDHNTNELMQLAHKIRQQEYPKLQWTTRADTCLRMRLKESTLGRGSTKNVRAVADLLLASVTRRAVRIAGGGVASSVPVDAVDVLGHEFGAAQLDSCQAWIDFNQLAGLDQAKATIGEFVEEINLHHESQKAGAAAPAILLSRCIVGAAGTGKLTVARAYATVLAEFDLVHDAEVIETSIYDLIGGDHRQTHSNTRKILGEAQCRVLVLRDLSEPSGSRECKAEFLAVMRMIRAHVKAARGVVLTVGRANTIERFFQSEAADWGDDQLFGWAERRITCKPHTQEELLSVLESTLVAQAITLNAEAREECTGALVRLSKRPYFADAKSVVRWAQDLIQQHRPRSAAGSNDAADMGERKQSDVDGDAPMHQAPLTLKLKDVLPPATRVRTVAEMFAAAGLTGCEDIIGRLQSLYDAALHARLSGAAEPYAQIPMTFAFVGPPGTGKTSVARIVGELFRDIGLVQSKQIIESCASELVDGYVGHTAAKTTATLRRSIDSVLFLDEAYQLNPRRTPHSYVGEALDEIVKALTSPELARRFVLILAGYKPDVEQLMQQNPGLGSRFPDHFHFQPFSVDDCWRILMARLGELKLKHVWSPAERATATATEASSAGAGGVAAMPEGVRTLLHALAVKHERDWGNARDLNTIAQRLHNRLSAQSGALYRAALVASGSSASVHSSGAVRAPAMLVLPKVNEDILVTELNTMLRDVKTRAAARQNGQ